MNKHIFPILAALLFLSACAPDPRKEALAFQIQTQAKQDALDAELNRAHLQDVHEFLMQQYEATAKEWRSGLNKMIQVGFDFATITVCVILLALAGSFLYGSAGMTSAWIKKAHFRAEWVPLDPETRTFPLLRCVHGQRYALSNPNTGSVLMLDVRNEADRQLIAILGATQIAGVIGQEARRSSDPASISVMRPPIVDVKDGTISLGADLWRQS